VSLPNVFDHADYRRFLGDWFRARKEANPRFSHRAFARKLGSTDPSLLVNIVSGRRRIPSDRIDGFVAAIGLEADEAEYFRLLVRFGHAETTDERERAWAAIALLRSRLRAPEIDSTRFLYASNRIYSAVHTLSECVGFRPDPAWIASVLRPRVSEAEAAEALDFLLRLGFLERQGDRMVSAEPNVRTPVRVGHLGSFGYHRQNQKLATETLEHLWDPDTSLAEETAFLGITISVPASRLGDLRALLWEAQLKVMHECETWPDRDQVVQVNIQMFPVSERTTDPT
jgi:uncharacterized protein (TIGR02147 family)